MRQSLRLLFLLLFLAAQSAGALTIPVTFTKLDGVTGGTFAATAVYKADLSGVSLASISSVSIRDSGVPVGAAGPFSGFDLDAVVLSATEISAAEDVSTLKPLSVFDFSPAGTSFTPGGQRFYAGPNLFGTDSSGARVDNSVATLGVFDGNSTTDVPPGFGFVSMGENGVLRFDLTSGVAPAGVFLYIGEVGDNWEVVTGLITVSDVRVAPEPSSLILLGSGLLGLTAATRRKRKA